VFLLIKKPEQILNVPILQVGAGVVGIATLIYIYRKDSRSISFKIDLPFWKEIFSHSLPMAASYLLIQIYLNFDMLLLGFIHGEKTVGLYSAAYKVITMINMFGLYYFLALFPNISRMYESSTEKMKGLLSRSLKNISLVALPLCVGGTIVARPLITLIFGNEFAMSALPFKILIWNVAVIWISLHYGNTLIACNRQNQYMVGVAIGAVTNIVLNLIFIPRYGMTAAAITTVLSELIVLWFMYLKLNTILRLSFLGLIPKPLLASIIMGITLYLVPEWHVIALIFIGAGTYFLSAIAIGAVSKEDLQSAYRYIVRRKDG
jgi:O-antigen/teichoic acid export membrane protein